MPATVSGEVEVTLALTGAFSSPGPTVTITRPVDFNTVPDPSWPGSEQIEETEVCSRIADALEDIAADLRSKGARQ